MICASERKGDLAMFSWRPTGQLLAAYKEGLADPIPSIIAASDLVNKSIWFQEPVSSWTNQVFMPRLMLIEKDRVGLECDIKHRLHKMFGLMKKPGNEIDVYSNENISTPLSMMSNYGMLFDRDAFSLVSLKKEIPPLTDYTVRLVNGISSSELETMISNMIVFTDRLAGLDFVSADDVKSRIVSRKITRQARELLAESNGDHEAVLPLLIATVPVIPTLLPEAGAPVKTMTDVLLDYSFKSDGNINVDSIPCITARLNFIIDNWTDLTAGYDKYGPLWLQLAVKAITIDKLQLLSWFCVSSTFLGSFENLLSSLNDSMIHALHTLTRITDETDDIALNAIRETGRMHLPAALWPRVFLLDSFLTACNGGDGGVEPASWPAGLSDDDRLQLVGENYTYLPLIAKILGSGVDAGMASRLVGLGNTIISHTVPATEWNDDMIKTMAAFYRALITASNNSRPLRSQSTDVLLDAMPFIRNENITNKDLAMIADALTRELHDSGEAYQKIGAHSLIDLSLSPIAQRLFV